MKLLLFICLFLLGVLFFHFVLDRPITSKEGQDRIAVAEMFFKIDDALVGAPYLEPKEFPSNPEVEIEKIVQKYDDMQYRPRILYAQMDDAYFMLLEVGPNEKTPASVPAMQEFLKRHKALFQSLDEFVDKRIGYCLERFPPGHSLRKSYFDMGRDASRTLLDKDDYAWVVSVKQRKAFVVPSARTMKEEEEKDKAIKKTGTKAGHP